jgi:RNA polymerase sigma factor (sigma-70 family)
MARLRHNVGEALSAFLQPNVLCVSAQEIEEVFHLDRTTRTKEVEREARRLVESYGDLSLRLAYTYLGSRQDAEDVSQDVLCKMICRPGAFNGPEHERAWVIRCTANACKDILRSAARSRNVPLTAAGEVRDPAPQVEEQVEKDELPGKVTAAVMRLAPPYREAVYLHYYEGMSIGQIARAVGATVTAVTKRLSRARKELRKSLEEKDDGRDNDGVSGRDGSRFSFVRGEGPDGRGSRCVGVGAD